MIDLTPTPEFMLSWCRANHKDVEKKLDVGGVLQGMRDGRGKARASGRSLS